MRMRNPFTTVDAAMSVATDLMPASSGGPENDFRIKKMQRNSTEIGGSL